MKRGPWATSLTRDKDNKKLLTLCEFIGSSFEFRQCIFTIL